LEKFDKEGLEVIKTLKDDIYEGKDE